MDAAHPGVFDTTLGSQTLRNAEEITSFINSLGEPAADAGPALETFVIDLGDLVFVGRSAGEPMLRRRLDRDAIEIVADR